MNLKHLESLIEALNQAGDEHFDMMNFDLGFDYDNPGEQVLGDCGTAACIAGYAGALAGEVPETWNSKSLARYLDIPEGVAFLISVGRGPCWDECPREGLFDITRQDAIQALIYLKEHHDELV